MRIHVLTGSALLLAALAALPSPARACSFYEAMTPMLFQEPPVLLSGEVAARVVILPADRESPGIRARIVEMLVGDYSGSILLLAPSTGTSCDLYPAEGETGIVAGRVVSSTPEALVVDPERAPSMAERGEYRFEAVRPPR
jgi:hypothetical protein